MANVESSGVAKAGLTTGVIGTSLAGLMALNNSSGNGLLNGLFGSNNNQMAVANALAERDAKIAELTAQKYSDSQDAVLYQATRSENTNLWNNFKEAITPIATKVEDTASRVTALEITVQKNSEINDLREKLVRSELGAQINQVGTQAASGIAALNSAITALNTELSNITKTVIPKDAICPEVMARYNSWTAPTTTTGS
jgi:hypothetical protein